MKKSSNLTSKAIRVEYNGNVYESQNTLRLILGISPSKFYKMIESGEIIRTDKEATLAIQTPEFVKFGSKIPVSYNGVAYESQKVLRKRLGVSPATFYEMLAEGEIKRFNERSIKRLMKKAA